jgi:peptide/nickel transport system substrate-binding protein
MASAGSNFALTRKRRRRGRMTPLLMLIALLVTACTTPQASTAPSGVATASQAPGTAAPTDPSTEASVLTVAIPGIGNGEWAPSRTGQDNKGVAMLVHETLTTVNPQTRAVEGLLAESFSVTPDGRTWTFKLRPNIPFHDDWGTVTAEDVRYTWQEWTSEDANHAAKKTLLDAVGGSMDGFKVVSDLEFRLTTTTPVTHLPSRLADQSQGLQVTSKRYHEEQGAAADQHPIGTAPWKFVSYTSGVEMVLEAVKDHWRQPPAFDRAVIKDVGDEAARLAGVQAGEFDIALLDSGLIDEADAAGLTISKIPDAGNVFIVLGGSYWGTDALDADAPWIQADAPEKGKAIREALSLAIDRPLILERILKGQGQLAYGALLQSSNPDLIDPSWSLPAYDVELAKQKLAEGGYPDGFPITLFMYPDYVDLPGIGEAVAGMWEEIGIQVTREPGEEEVLEARLDATDTDGIAFVKVAGLKGEPASQIVNYLSANPTSHHFFHPSIDDGYERLVNEPDEKSRYGIAREILAALKDDYIVLSMYTVDLPFAIGPRVADWSPIPGLDEASGLETVTRQP